MIAVRGLARTLQSRRGPVEAVRGVDFRVRAGEIVGFLGPNGAGKTTTLRMLATLLDPTAGSAAVAGKAEPLLVDNSWNVHPDQYIRNYLVLGTPPKARVEVKTRSKASPVVREYPLPFNIEE